MENITNLTGVNIALILIVVAGVILASLILGLLAERWVKWFNKMRKDEAKDEHEDNLGAW